MDLSKTIAPEVGDIVLYTVRDGQRSGETRAAIITRTFHQPHEDGSIRTNWAVNLSLFPDNSNHAMHEELHASSSLYDETGKKGTWRHKSPVAVTQEMLNVAFSAWAFREKEKEDAEQAKAAADVMFGEPAAEVGHAEAQAGETAAGSTPLHGKKKR